MLKLVKSIAKQINKKDGRKPEIAIILGSGLAEFVDVFENKNVITYDELKGMLKSSVKGHKNQFVIGSLNGKTVICMQGRFHPYDGFNAKQVAMPVYLFKELGVKTLILTNASGAVNKEYNAGDIMLIKSHINLTGMNPLIGGMIMDFGKQFIDMTNCYSQSYINTLLELGKENDIDFKVGVYAQMLGPTYETPAEVNMLRVLGVDTVAMSTALEAIAGCQCEMNVVGFSCVSNKAVSFDDNHEVLSHEDVLKASARANEKLKLILPKFIEKI